MRFLDCNNEETDFVDQWIALVMRCIRIVSYSILINGMSHQAFKPSRGIKQGDPLSSYLFILCFKAHSSLLNHVENKGHIIGIPIA